MPARIDHQSPVVRLHPGSKARVEPDIFMNSIELLIDSVKDHANSVEASETHQVGGQYQDDFYRDSSPDLCAVGHDDAIVPRNDSIHKSLVRRIAE
jgi:hypothetical protein